MAGSSRDRMTKSAPLTDQPNCDTKPEKKRLHAWRSRIKIVNSLTAFGALLTLIVTIDTLYVMQRQFRDSTIIQDSRHFENQISDVMNRVKMDLTLHLLYHGRPFLRDCVRRSDSREVSGVVYTQELCEQVAIEALYGLPNQSGTGDPPLLEHLFALSLQLSRANDCISRGECHAIVTMGSFCSNFDTYFDIFIYLDSEFLRHTRENDSVALAVISSGTLTSNLMTANAYCRQIADGEIKPMPEHGILSFFL